VIGTAERGRQGPGPIVTSQRQIAENRRNASRSTDPRSARRLVNRHGLGISLLSSAATKKQTDKLSPENRWPYQSEIVLKHGRDAAEVQLELERVRKISNALIQRVPTLDRRGRSRSVGEPQRCRGNAIKLITINRT